MHHPRLVVCTLISDILHWPAHISWLPSFRYIDANTYIHAKLVIDCLYIWSTLGSDLGPEEIAAASECISSQWVGFGGQVASSSRVATARSLTNFLMVDSGSNALYLACHLLDLPAGSEVVLPFYVGILRSISFAGRFKASICWCWSSYFQYYRQAY